MSWGQGGNDTRCAPNRNWKGVYPVDLFMVLITWKRMRGSARTQPVWFRSTWKRSSWFTVLLVRSLAPSVWGWYAVEQLWSIPARRQRCCQKRDRFL